MSEKFQTLHPDIDKSGVNIDKGKYDTVKDAIISIITEHDVISFSELTRQVGAKLPSFDGSIGWYTTSIKLDLEARNLIERIPNQSPQQLRLKI